MTNIRFKLRKSQNSEREGVLQLQISHQRKFKQLTTTLKIFPEEWDAKKELVIINTLDPGRFAYLSEVNNKLQIIHSRLSKALLQYAYHPDEVDLDEIAADYFRKTRKRKLFGTYARKKIRELRQSGNGQKAARYNSAVIMYLRYRPDDMPLENITHIEMLHFEIFLANRGMVPNSSSYYMRIIRAIYNKAVEDGFCEQKNPFRDVFTGVAATKKRAVTADIIRSLQLFKVENRLRFAKDLFLFSFFMRGMSFADMAALRKKNIKNGYATYKRQKTGATLTIKVENCAKLIMKRYRKKGEHIFPQLNKTENRRSALRLYNMHLKEISDIMGLDLKLTSYTARHTWASIAKRKGIALRIISEAMGHSSEKTTAIYLDSLDIHAIDEANNIILQDFMKNRIAD